MAMSGSAALPYKKTDKTPNLAYVDEADDIRGGMGLEGLKATKSGLRGCI